jgi:plastocyanin
MIKRMGRLLGGLALLVAGEGPAQPATGMHDMSQHNGMVMNANATTLPRDCDEIAAEHAFTIHAGAVYSEGFPGTTFGYSERELAVEPCSRVTITFVNDDQVRHQWMVHGLPRYLYPGGMFHIEANGGESQTGSFIVPSDERTYLIHCDLPQHMEKGMKAQLVVGRGDGDLWAIPGISGDFNRDSYTPRGSLLALVVLALVIATGVGVGWLARRR